MISIQFVDKLIHYCIRFATIWILLCSALLELTSVSAAKDAIIVYWCFILCSNYNFTLWFNRRLGRDVNYTLKYAVSYWNSIDKYFRNFTDPYIRLNMARIIIGMVRKNFTNLHHITWCASKKIELNAPKYSQLFTLLHNLRFK